MVKGGSLPRVPDCFQRTPKKVTLQSLATDINPQLLTLMVDGQGVHAIVKNAEPHKLSHRVYNLSSGKVEIDSKLPTNVAAFMGLQPLEMSNMKFFTTGENEFVSVLLDGSSTVYPLVKDSTPTGDSIKDPQLLDLPPIQALGLGMVSHNLSEITIFGYKHFIEKVCHTI